MTERRPERPGFSFGENWLKYLEHMHPAAVEVQIGYVRDWLGDISGRTLIDIGSGSGLTSLVANELGATVTSLDVDPASVRATGRLRERAGSPTSWTVREGSILDEALVSELGTFDIVASWGALHHTGDVWRAIDNAARLTRPDGRLWIALYLRTRASARSLRTKRLYNRLPGPAQAAWRLAYAAVRWARSVLRGDPTPWRTYHRRRGMDWRRDIEDWLGGLPYEPVGPGEVLARLRPRGFELERLLDGLGEGGNDVYLFHRRPAPVAEPDRGA